MTEALLSYRIRATGNYCAGDGPMRLPGKVRPIRGYATRGPSTIAANGSPFHRRDPGGKAMAIRAQVGRISMPGFLRWQPGWATVEVTAIVDPLFDDEPA
jgi:hypothetical protein